MDAFLLRLPRPLGRAVQRYREAGVSVLAAAIAFYALLSFFPFVLLLVRALMLLEAHVAVESFVLSISGPYFPDYQDFIASVLDRIYGLSEDIGVWWLVALLWASSYFTTSISHSLHVIFGTPPPPSMLVRKLFDLAIVAVVVLVLAVLALLDTILTAVMRLPLFQQLTADLPLLDLLQGPLSSVLAFVLAMVLLAALYAITPRRRLLPAAVLVGAACATAAMEGVKHGYTWYITTLGVHEWLYGSLAAVIVTVLWFYVVALIFLAGAILVEALDYVWRDGRPEMQEEADSH